MPRSGIDDVRVRRIIGALRGFSGPLEDIITSPNDSMLKSAANREPRRLLFTEELEMELKEDMLLQVRYKVLGSDGKSATSADGLKYCCLP